MKFNREYFSSDKFYATIVVSIAFLAIAILLIARDSVQFEDKNPVSVVRKITVPQPPPDRELTETFKPSSARIKAANKEANEQTLKEKEE